MSLPDDTIRKKIIYILENTRTPLTAYEIALELGLDPREGEKTVYEHIRHIAKSIRRLSGGRKLVYMEPPMCRNCGYVFRDLSEPRKPSKCPRCKSQRITPPRFYIDEA